MKIKLISKFKQVHLMHKKYANKFYIITNYFKYVTVLTNSSPITDG